MSLIKKIKDYYKKNKTYLFTTPSHSQGNFIIPVLKEIIGKNYFKNDFSEIEGFDNLREPEGVIKKLLNDISKIYDTKATFMLTNGSTSGIVAAMLAVLKTDDKVIIARNCHISVYNGLVLSGARPVWFLPEFDNNWGIYKGITGADIKKQIAQNPDAKALIITSPTYEGTFSEIEDIAKLCKKKNITLIVDEAHGALLNFGHFKVRPAIQCGADISIQSLHKTAGAPNPCAVLHISKSSKISAESIQQALNLINTTSPSYPMMCAIEGTVKYLNSQKGKKHITKLFKMIDDFKKTLPDSVEIYSNNNDITKILLKIKGVNSLAVAELLNNEFNIEEEFSTDEALLFITGIGTDSKKLKALQKALKKISKMRIDKREDQSTLSYSLPQMIYTPAEAYKKNKITIDANNAEGKISAEAIVKYPPGIPVLLPGEVIDLNSMFSIEKSQITICE